MGVHVDTPAPCAVADQRAAHLSQLRSAMSSVEMTLRLQRDWDYARNHGLDVIGCDLIRVMPRGPLEFVAEYRVHVAAADGPAMLGLFGELVGENVHERHHEAVASLSKARRKQISGPGPGDTVSYIAELGMILRLAGIDEKISGLRFVHKPRKAREILAPWIDTGGLKLKNVQPELLGHRLGKRCAIRFRYELKDRETGEHTPGSVFAKMYKRRSPRGAELADTHTLLAGKGFTAGSDVRIPALVGYLPEWEMLLTEDVAGASLADLEREAFSRGVTMAARAIARLHACDHRPEREHATSAETELLEGWVALVGEVFADLRRTTADALEQVRAELASISAAPTSLVHRDFYEKQVIIDGDDTILLDFDTLCTADPAIDLGNFIAHIKLARAKGIEVDADLEIAFLRAYLTGRDGAAGAVGEDFERRVDVYTRSTLLRLVCLYSFWPKFQGVPARLIEDLS